MLFIERYYFQCSDYARGIDLLQVVSEINAKILFSIHSEHPEAYRKITKNMSIVEEEKEYNIGN